ncbi:MAG: nucleotidyltransferase family protein [Solirubrobacteraceae bacterium]
MNLCEASVRDQLEAFEQIICCNPVVVAILERMAVLDLPDRWLAAGGLVQTVWNVLSDRDPAAGILDYDVNYYDASDLSWEAEEKAIAGAAAVFDGVEGRVEVRNEARVHLWYVAKFGVSCPPYRSTRHAIASFPNCSSCLGVRPGDGRLEVFAPFGMTDLFALTARPNPVLAPAAVYVAKTQRWAREWPRLTILPWPDDRSGSASAPSRLS